MNKMPDTPTLKKMRSEIADFIAKYIVDHGEKDRPLDEVIVSIIQVGAIMAVNRPRSAVQANAVWGLQNFIQALGDASGGTVSLEVKPDREGTDA